jgi:hypothetical protein
MSDLPYPSMTPSSAPYSYTTTSLSTYSPFVSPSPAPAPTSSPFASVSSQFRSLSASPYQAAISTHSSILSNVSDDAFYGIICAIVVVILYTLVNAIYYYKKFKKERARIKRLADLHGKSHSSVRNVLNPAYPELLAEYSKHS